MTVHPAMPMLTAMCTLEAVILVMSGSSPIHLPVSQGCRFHDRNVVIANSLLVQSEGAAESRSYNGMISIMSAC